MNRSSKTYRLGIAITALLIVMIAASAVTAPGLFNNDDDTTNDIQLESSGAEYPPHTDPNGTGPHLDRPTDDNTTTPSSSDANGSDSYDSVPELNRTAQFGATANVGFSHNHTLLFDGEQLRPGAYDSGRTPVSDTESTFTYTVHNNGSSSIEFIAEIEFTDANGDTITTRTKTHTIQPGETMTNTEQFDLNNHNAE